MKPVKREAKLNRAHDVMGNVLLAIISPLMLAVAIVPCIVFLLVTKGSRWPLKSADKRTVIGSERSKR